MSFSTLVGQKILEVKHLLCSGHSFFDLQLHPYSRLTSGFKNVGLWDNITDAMLHIPLQLTLNLLLLNIFCNGFPCGKCFFINFKNVLPILVLTFIDFGGLNQLIFLLRRFFSSVLVSLYLSLVMLLICSIKPFFCKAT